MGKITNYTRTYNIWKAMRQRCLNKNNKSYKDYGGRGITICKEWESFKNFLTDMGEKPEGLSIDRIDNNGNYCKENCRWTTPKEQANNTRDNITIKYKNKRISLLELSEITKITVNTLYYRHIRGWNDKELTKLVAENKKRNYEIKELKKNGYKEKYIMNKYDISRSTIWYIINK